MSIEQRRASISANINEIRKAVPPQPQKANVAAQAALNLLEMFLNDMAEMGEASKPQVMLQEVKPPELSEDAIRNVFSKPAQVADPLPQGATQKLATELTQLCAAETEGKFFDKVTDNIATIVLALNAYNPPPASLMETPREGTKPFKGPVSETGEYRTPENGA